MKRMFSLIIAMLILCSALLCTVSAEEAGTLSCYLLDGEVKNGQVITVRIELNGLSGTAGAVLVENKYYFDPSALKFVSLEANHPEKWDFANEVAEDWSKLYTGENEDGTVPANAKPYIYHVVMNPMLDNAVTEDHVLYIDVKFEVLDETKEVAFEAKDCYWTSYSTEKNDFLRHDVPGGTIKLSGKPADGKEGGFDWKILAIAGGVIVLAGGVTAVVLAKRKKK